MRELLSHLHSTPDQFWLEAVFVQYPVCAKVVQRASVHQRQYSVSYIVTIYGYVQSNRWPSAAIMATERKRQKTIGFNEQV